MATYILGTGGHARALRERYPDAKLVPEGEESLMPKGAKAIVGWLGQTPEELSSRVEKVTRLMVQGISISSTPMVMLGASVCPSATLGLLSVVNQGAVVCHDCYVGIGAHVGPGAVLCGNVTVGRYSMVGAGAVVLPNTVIPEGALVKANTRHPL